MPEDFDVMDILLNRPKSSIMRCLRAILWVVHSEEQLVQPEGLEAESREGDLPRSYYGINNYGNASSSSPGIVESVG